MQVRVEAAALNPTDMANFGVMGEVQAGAINAEGGALTGGISKPAARPRGFGGEGCGVVVAVGADADPSWLGKRVAAWSLLTQGSYAEYYKVPAGWTVELPDDVSFIEAAAPAVRIMSHVLPRVSLSSRSILGRVLLTFLVWFLLVRSTRSRRSQ